ncbi:acyl-CoA thioesterase [Sphingobium chlorophenolicum]|uniref:Thioesterase superfamily protein n=1 Tax=Sphingobium chlorophenolicum TaxID=46429 RepID=A0A081REP5_SPHCR|nr:thioesterase family protein [Sphingobium chlorophenolicum]KEQ53668.1 Thioesterase superfamily protein [Sphingobium chlorophenolicum]
MSRTPPRPRAAYRHWTPITTRWHDNDVYGHVNNTVYYAWFDTAVNAWLVEAGLLDVISGDPIGLVVETGCRYAAPLAFPQPVEIGLTVAKIGSSSVTYHLGVFGKDMPDAAAEGHFTHVYVDRQNRRPAPLPPEWRAILERQI